MCWMRLFWLMLVCTVMPRLCASVGSKSKCPVAVAFDRIKSFDHVPPGQLLVHYCYRPEHLFLGNSELYPTLYERYAQLLRPTNLCQKEQALKHWQKEYLKGARIASNEALRDGRRETAAPLFSHVVVNHKNKEFGFDVETLPSGFSMVQCVSCMCDASFQQMPPSGSLLFPPSHLAHCIVRDETLYGRRVGNIYLVRLFAHAFSEILRQLACRKKQASSFDNDFVMVLEPECDGSVDTIAVPLIGSADFLWKRRLVKTSCSLESLQVMGYAQGLKQFLSSEKPLSVRTVRFLTCHDKLKLEDKDILRHFFYQVLKTSPEDVLRQLERRECEKRRARRLRACR